MQKNKKLKWLIPVAILLVLTVTYFVYINIYYHADPCVEASLITHDGVTVSKTDYGWYFDGASTGNALIFYCGAKVEETAYSPLFYELAKEGIDVFLLKIPFRLAFFGINKADSIISRYNYDNWYVGGHSLGGAMAASYASSHSNELAGVILLAAYSPTKLDDGLNTILIYGTNDTVLNHSRYSSCLANTPDTRTEHIISGGNHSGFAFYGNQSGDGTATISADEQISETVRVIVSAID